jgi:hypothetical protein
MNRRLNKGSSKILDARSLVPGHLLGESGSLFLDPAKAEIYFIRWQSTVSTFIWQTVGIALPT